MDNNSFKYINQDDLKNLYGYVPDKDSLPSDVNQTDFVAMAIAISSERVNSICGNSIEQVGFSNLNDTQQKLVKRATARLTIYYIHEGMSFLRASVSISGNGLSESISPPAEPDYILNEVFFLLQQSGLYIIRKAFQNDRPKYCEKNNLEYFNQLNIYDESDCRVVNWDSGNKTFLQKIGLIAGDNIILQDVSDTIPKVKINSNFNLSAQELYNKYFLTSDFDIVHDKIFISGHIWLWRLNNTKWWDYLTTNKKTIIGAINEINAKSPDLSNYYTKSEIDNLLNQKQNKLTAGTNITIDSNNVISASGGGTGDNWVKVATSTDTQVINYILKTTDYYITYRYNITPPSKSNTFAKLFFTVKDIIAEGEAVRVYREYNGTGQPGDTDTYEYIDFLHDKIRASISLGQDMSIAIYELWEKQ